MKLKAGKYLQFLILICLATQLPAQENKSFSAPAGGQLQAGIGAAIFNFKGDESKEPYSSSGIHPGMELALENQDWRFSVPIQHMQLTWQNPENAGVENFKTQAVITGLNAQWFLPLNRTKLRPFLGTGYNFLFFSVKQDLRSKNGIPYHFWSDGNIRDLPELPENLESANLIERDFVFETKSLNRQRMSSFPISIGFRSALSNQFQLQLAYSYMFLQGDNLDFSVEQTGWDRLSSIQVSIAYTFNQKKGKKAPKMPGQVVDYNSVDFASLFNADEDNDGIPDDIDKCYGTPRGAPVDEFGCSPDSDLDGIPDFLDEEPQSPANSRVHSNGKSWSDSDYLNYYNDSLSYFVQTLRKVNKNSRPWPVGKYVDKTAYYKWGQILDKNPEWIPQRIGRKDKLPAEIQMIDTNKDGYFSLNELENAVNMLFDGKNPDLNEEVIRKAIEYAFRNQ